LHLSSSLAASVHCQIQVDHLHVGTRATGARTLTKQACHTLPRPTFSPSSSRLDHRRTTPSLSLSPLAVSRITSPLTPAAASASALLHRPRFRLDVCVCNHCPHYRRHPPIDFEAPAAPRRHAHLCCRASVDRRLGPRLSTPVLAAPPPSTRPSGALCCRQRKLRPLVSCETSARDDFQPTWLTACTTSTRPFICVPPATPAPHAPLLYYRHNGGEDDAVQAGGAGRWRRGQDGPDHTGRPLIMP
jgi:hypothetical protein